MCQVEDLRAILDRMAKLNEQQLNEFGQPYIGIFYIINEEIYWEGEHPRLIQTLEFGQKNYSKTHSQYFYQTICRFLPEVKITKEKLDLDDNRAWKYHPRGRVLCSESNTDFVVYCDAHITHNPKYQAKIREEMNLPYNTKFETDGHHYKCHICEPMKFV
jgi:hypothetical protein